MPEWPADYCPSCHVPMRLIAVEPALPFFPASHTYECRQCRVILSRDIDVDTNAPGRSAPATTQTASAAPINPP